MKEVLDQLDLPDTEKKELLFRLLITERQLNRWSWIPAFLQGPHRESCDVLELCLLPREMRAESWNPRTAKYKKVKEVAINDQLQTETLLGKVIQQESTYAASVLLLYQERSSQRQDSHRWATQMFITMLSVIAASIAAIAAIARAS